MMGMPLLLHGKRNYMHVCRRIVHHVVLFLFNEIRMEGTTEGDKFKEISSS
jgi:hypothetical protein